MYKVFTIVTVLFMTSATYASNESYHLMTLDLVETMLWNEGFNSSDSGDKKDDLSEELAVGLDLLDS